MMVLSVRRLSLVVQARFSSTCSIWRPASATHTPHSKITHQNTDTQGPVLTNNYIISSSGHSGNWFHQPIRFAGHSHWQNTRHIKAAHQKIKDRNNIIVTQRIKTALKGGGGSDQKHNKDLERAFDLGKAKNIPMATLLEAVKRETEGLEKGSELIAEVRGHGNFFFIVECYTDKPTRTRKTLHILAKKYSAQLLEAGGASHHFEKKGVVFVKQNDAQMIDMDQATELAIEAGAEDVISTVNDDKQKVLEFHGDPKDLHSIKVALEEKSLHILEHRFAYVPVIFTKLNEMELKIAGNFMDILLEDNEVIRVYDNIEPPADSVS